MYRAVCERVPDDECEACTTAGETALIEMKKNR